MAPKALHFISWNVNGIRSILNKDALQAVFDLGPDVLCLQETKACVDSIPEVDLMDFPYRYFHYSEKKGYSGTAILSHIEPEQVIYDFPKPKVNHPPEGRVIAAEFGNLILVNAYVPNSKRGLLRLPYRDQEWDPDFRNYLVEMAKAKPVVVCGDFNVAHEGIDIANPKSNRRNAGFTDEERANFTTLLEDGFVDAFRALHPGELNHYSWWSYRSNARERNIGWRIDYFLVSRGLFSQIYSSEILANIYGSDHAPISLHLKV